MTHLRSLSPRNRLQLWATRARAKAETHKTHCRMPSACDVQRQLNARAARLEAKLADS